MIEENKKEFIKKPSTFWEKVQDIGIFIALIMGVQKAPQPGSPEAKSGRIPDWFTQFLPESFTLEDESWRNLIISSHPTDPVRATKTENEFRRRMGKDPAGYDTGEYRRRLMHVRKEFLAEASKKPIKNVTNARIQFEQILFHDPCILFLDQLIAETEAGGTDDVIYDRQREFAVRQNYLVPIKGWKRSIAWIRENKVTTLIGIFMLPWGMIQLLNWLLN